MKPVVDRSQLKTTNIPKHVAIIMDGNRRWAKRRRKLGQFGHIEGAKNLSNIVEIAKSLGIKVLTVYAFSTENWLRPENEVCALMDLFKLYLSKKRPFLQKNRIRLTVIGDIDRLSSSLQKEIHKTTQIAAEDAEFDLVVAMNYGGRDEICRACKKIAQLVKDNRMQPEEITEKVFASYLDTHKLPDLDLLIRTSGETRISNFLLWQLSYAQIVTTEVLWPDFCEADLIQAVIEYQKSDRRRGG